MERVEDTSCNNFDSAIYADTLFENYPDAMWIKNRNSKIIRANDFYYKYFKDSECIETKEADKEILRTGCKKIFNLRTQNKIFAITAIPVKREELVEYIIYTSRDVTEQEELKERFFVNKYQLDALLENVPKLIYMKDTDGKYITGTKYSKEFFENGFDYFHNTFLDFPSIKDRNTNEDNFVTENNKLISYAREINDTKGVPHWYKIYKVPINDFNNEVTGIITLANNIDAEKQLNTQRETFVASLGHDLKNPTIAQIRGLELLLKGEFGEITFPQRELVEMILDSCRYMNGMLSTLLSTYRNDEGIVKLNYSEFSLPDLVMECVSEMIYVAKDKGVEISINSSIKEGLVNADRVQIKRVIMNLLSNGIKYAYKDTVLKLSVYEQNNNACFEFENNSPYIPEEKQKAIFAQYVTYASAHKELGIGLGLYTSKKIIEAHKGNIFVNSFKDERNIFGFKIPCKPQKSGGSF